MIFTGSKRSMESYVYVFGILLVGFIIYMIVREYIFDTTDTDPSELFESNKHPAAASIEIRQAPTYPPRVIASSGPSAPSQEAPLDEVIVHQEPRATDPYQEHQESSDIPENLRHPERSFRAPPINDNTSIAVQSGVASERVQVSADNSQTYQQDIIQGGGEFMPGIFANDTYTDTSYSTF